MGVIEALNRPAIMPCEPACIVHHLGVGKGVRQLKRPGQSVCCISHCQIVCCRSQSVCRTSQIVCHGSEHTVLLLPAMAQAVIETWRADQLTVIDKLKINDLILLLSSMDGLLLRYMHVFRIVQNVQEKFASGIFYVLINMLLNKKDSYSYR